MIRILFLLLTAIVPAVGQSIQPLHVIAFGSCSHESDSIQLWDDIIEQKPDLWIWAGDNIYGDTHDMALLKMKYDIQKGRPSYQRLLRTCPVIGTWDDHDYGVNDGGKFFPKKEESKERALAFLDIPADAEVRTHPGMYSSHVYGPVGRKVKVILLDTRTFRDTLIPGTQAGKRYDPNMTGGILGDAQWTWLEHELGNSDADLNIIVSSIQVLANDHNYEKWGNFPLERRRMMDLVLTTPARNIIFISGDRHIGEVSKLNLPGLSYTVYDFTSSGLTHTWDRIGDEVNLLRVGELIVRKNFGVIRINWDGKQPAIEMEIRGHGKAQYQTLSVTF